MAILNDTTFLQKMIWVHLGQFWKKLGNIFFHHLVTLIKTSSLLNVAQVQSILSFSPYHWIHITSSKSLSLYFFCNTHVCSLLFYYFLSSFYPLYITLSFSFSLSIICKIWSLDGVIKMSVALKIEICFKLREKNFFCPRRQVDTRMSKVLTLAVPTDCFSEKQRKWNHF